MVIKLGMAVSITSPVSHCSRGWGEYRADPQRPQSFLVWDQPQICAKWMSFSLQAERGPRHHLVYSFIVLTGKQIQGLA